MRAQIFFVLSGQQLLRMQIFFSCPVTSPLLGARSFFYASAQPAHHAAAFFSLFSHFSMHACQGHQRYFFLLFVQSLPAAARTVFFVTSVQQCEGYRAHRTFLLRSSFSFVVRSHLRRHSVATFSALFLQIFTVSFGM
jgi:hypothetical protein